MNSNLPDTSQECPIWRQFRRGDADALAALFNEHYDSLYHYGLRLLRDEEVVKDCVQNLFVRIWTSRDRLMAVKSPRSYLLKALRRHIGDQVVQTNRRKAVQEEMVDEFRVMFSHEDFLIANQRSAEQSQMLSACLNSLTARQREAIFLRFYEELEYERIAEVMALNMQSVRNLIHQGLKCIKEKMGADRAPVVFFMEKNTRSI